MTRTNAVNHTPNWGPKHTGPKGSCRGIYSPSIPQFRGIVITSKLRQVSLAAGAQIQEALCSNDTRPGQIKTKGPELSVHTVRSV